ncbi:MAG TPA: c-type cytochrome [Tepidisphaeraceae bacterium]|nr:c-type cytochrome [Tepidisphaeraceae bacterium]
MSSRAIAADPGAVPVAKWIWGPGDKQEKVDRYFRTTFDVNVPKNDQTFSAQLWAAGDDEIEVSLNGKTVAKSDAWTHAVIADVRPELVSGKNVLAVKCRNDTGPGGIALKLEIRGADRKPFVLVTDGTWKTSPDLQKGWRAPKFDDHVFPKSAVLGDYGMQPWGHLEAVSASEATPVDDLTLLPGFKAELIYNVPKASEGSWVSMTPDPKGRLYVSDQAGGLFRVTPSKGNSPTKVEPVDLDIGSAQGLLWAFDSLYVVVNGMKMTHESGLYRLRDTNGDDKLDQIDTLKLFQNRTKEGPAFGEHGPHAVVLGPDKKLYLVAGNFSNMPQGILPTSPAQNWAEDLFLERMPDGRGHDPTIYAPGSWVCRTDENGKTWEAFAMGMRNAYDIAFNPDGELFTFDSDMEWDMGMPWYRPTRICHVVSGAEFGWRNGSAKWPTYYPDSVPPVVNIGPGSPTGVTFGTGAKFPAKYQRAFFANDWAYGKIYAVYLKEDGAGYKADFEPFVIGKPFDVTDIVINTDGAMYVTIGGRGTQSGLYRITYVGNESTKPAPPIKDPKAADARDLRHALEAYQGHQDPAAVSFAWKYLGSEDRHLRYAARVAIEAQDPATWTEKTLTEPSPTARINAIVALCRRGNVSLQPRVLSSLGELNLATLTNEQLLEALRAYELCLIRMGKPADPGMTQSLMTKFDALFPNANNDATHELCQLQVYLKSPDVIAKSLALLEKAPSQEEQLFYIFNLRNVKEGWTRPQRETYFTYLNRAQQNYNGGASFKLFVDHIRKDAINTLSTEEKSSLAQLLKAPMELAPKAANGNIPTRKFVRSWTMADLTPELSRLKSGRSYAKGKEVFASLSCVKCHRFNGEGGASGPDISGVGNRFQPTDLLEAIVLPSKVISDQYQATEFITKKKEMIVGTVHEENDQQVVVRSSPLSTATETVLKKDIAERRPSKTSIMPQGLIDVCTADEILDLLAYLRSAGDPNDPAFRPGKPTAQSASIHSSTP